MRILTRFLAATILAAAWQLPGIAGAQDQPASPDQQSPTTGFTQPSEKIPDQKLDAAASALQRVAKLQEDYEQQMKRVAQDAREAATKAVTEQGLSVEEYTQILQTAQNDPDVREKLLQRIKPTDGADKADRDKAPATSGQGK